MTNVWYMGTAATRIITVAQWAAAGVAGVAKDSVWNVDNRWALPLTDFNSSQRTILTSDGLFWLSAPDTGRPGDVVLAPDDPLPQYVRDSELFDVDGTIRADLIPGGIGTGTGDVTETELADAVAAGVAFARDRTNHTNTQPLESIEISGTPDGTKFLKDDGSWAYPPGGLTSVAVADLSDVTPIGEQLGTASDEAAACDVIDAHHIVAGARVKVTQDYTTAGTARAYGSRTDVTTEWRGPVLPTNMIAGDEWTIVG